MGLFGKKDTEEGQKSIGKITQEKANEIIKTLSGGEVKYTKKLVDNIVVMTGASGGTGVSTLLSNLAYLISEEGLRVIVIDLNILYPTQHLYFSNEKDIQLEKADLVSYLTGRNPLGDSIESSGKVSLLYANNRGLMDSINCESDSAIANFQEAIRRLRQLFDIVLIDCPMRIDHMLCNTAFYMADNIYMVWDEGISSIANTERIRRNMASSGIDAYTKTKVILNKRTNIHYNDYPFKKLNMELIQILPFEQDITYTSLRSEVFCEKGASSSKNANIFYGGMVNLANIIMQNGGLIK